MGRIEKQVVVKRKNGLHARPATLFVQLANKFNSFVQIKNKKESADGKSIIAVLSLGVKTGDKVRLAVEGEDAREASREIINFLQEDD